MPEIVLVGRWQRVLGSQDPTPPPQARYPSAGLLVRQRIESDPRHKLHDVPKLLLSQGPRTRGRL
ncbi:MAG: hypothetical protein H0V51_01465 [Chloroflexi bacterium]|nr:hypothetical protein [Chloroflexota bacterium]